MKTKSIFHNAMLCLFILSLFLACKSGSTSSTENLAPNPSFEQAKESIVSGWEGIHASITYTWSEDIAHSGKHSVCISNLPAQRSADWSTSEHISITPETRYTLSAYVKGDFDREVYISVFPIDASGDYMEGVATDISFNNTDWTYAEITFTTPPDAVAVELDLGTNNPSDTASAGMICYDDVLFR